MSSAKVTETGDRVFIDHIPPMKYGEQMDNTFVRSMQLSLNALGENLNYDYLMGVSGAAFRLHFDPKWCPSSVDATVGFDVSREIFVSLGYKLRFIKINPNSFSDIKSLYKKIKFQIDSGRPIVAINLMGNMDWGIITGYLKNEPGILCRTFYDETKEYSLAIRAPWLNFFIREKKNGMASDELFINSLKIALRLANTRKFEEYYNGFAAYEIWIRRLKSAVKSFNQKDLAQVMEIHFIIQNALLDSRRSAVKYLSAEKAAEKLQKGEQIVENYREIVQLLESSNTNLGQYGSLTREKQMETIIHDQANTLSKVYDLEKQNILLIKQAINN
jgi:hypothetical protein